MAQLEGWALILGASSGFGGATARALAQAGMDICGVHLDRKQTMHLAESVRDDVEAAGRRCVLYNINASDESKRAEALDDLKALMEADGRPDGLRVLMHSLAFGSLLPFVQGVDAEGGKCITPRQMDMTADVMAHSLVYWTQQAVARGMIGRGGRIYAMTSSGGTRVMPSYGAVSAAKAALESHCRQLSYELGPRGIAVNALRAGVTDTPALRKIPGSDALLAGAVARNPGGRLTAPEDVAQAIVALTGPGGGWISGNVLGIDGGEDVIGF